MDDFGKKESGLFFAGGLDRGHRIETEREMSFWRSDDAHPFSRASGRYKCRFVGPTPTFPESVR
jgi:hypothetical protein